MNSCILMVEVIADPELRKTTDDRDVANMMVEFPGLRDEDPTARMRVVGWGNLGVDMSQKYHTGDRIIVEGRLSMNLIEREGYKEKRAELIASHIYAVGQANSSSQGMVQPLPTPANVVNLEPLTPEPEIAPTPQYTAPPAIADTETETYDEGTLDEIPFVRPVYSRTNIDKSLLDSWELAANHYWDGHRAIRHI